jgi:hypothetical protein
MSRRPCNACLVGRVSLNKRKQGFSRSTKDINTKVVSSKEVLGKRQQDKPEGRLPARGRGVV